MRKVLNLSLFFGALAGVLYFLFFVLMYFTIPNPLANKMAPLGLQLIIVLFGIWYYKKINETYLHFYEGFTIGFVGNLLAALLSGLLIYGFVELIDMTPFTTWISESVSFLLGDRESKKEIMSDETFERMLESVSNSKTTSIIFDRLMASFWVIFPIGLFSMALRKIKPVK
jgi:hypothetical protein